MSDGRVVGRIGNYYGGLHIRETDGRYEWSIENYDGHCWDEIPESLYAELDKLPSPCSKCAGTGKKMPRGGPSLVTCDRCDGSGNEAVGR